MNVAVILVHVVERMGVDHGWPDGLDDAADHADRRIAFADLGVLEISRNKVAPSTSAAISDSPALVLSVRREPRG